MKLPDSIVSNKMGEFVIHYRFMTPYYFLLFCSETTRLESDFDNQNLWAVLEIFKVDSKEYISRVVTKKK